MEATIFPKRLAKSIEYNADLRSKLAVNKTQQKWGT